MVVAGASAPFAAVAAVPAAKKTEAAALSTVAISKAKAKKFAVAASMFHEAYKIDPETHGYLYSAARAAHKAKDWAAAEKDYRKFIANAPGDHPFMANANRHLGTVVAARQAHAKEKKAEEAVAREKAADKAKAAPVVAKKSAPAGGGPGAASYAALGGGALLAIGGAVVLVMRSGDADQLNSDLDAGSIAEKDAQEQLDSINTRGTLGYGLIGAGVVAAGVGAYLLMSAPDKTASALGVDPLNRRLLVTLRF